MSNHRVMDPYLSISRAVGELARRHGRAPTPSELAAHLEIGRAEVLEMLKAGDVCPSAALSGDGTGLGFGEVDIELAGVDDRETLLPLIKGLPDRERVVFGLRFEHNMTQSQIAERVGVPQVHVALLLARTLTSLREGLGAR